MDASHLAGRIEEWADEFFRAREESFDIPKPLWRFLANRLADLGHAEDDPDVVRVRVLLDGPYRKVRIKDFSAAGLRYVYTDGAEQSRVPEGITQMDRVSPEDRQKLSGILERIEASRIK